MKNFAILIIFAIATHSYGYPQKSSSSHGINVTELIKEEGYPVQNITVQTNDGYLLDVIRIPGPPNYSQMFYQAHKQNHDVQTNKPVVFLMHGLLGSAEEFVAGGRSRGLAYKLADQGFDVFLGNSRGNRYAYKHIHLNPEKDTQFWKYCWDEIGTRDLPAMLDKVLKTTAQKKLHYIGYNQGNTAFYVMASKKPEYNSKVDKMIALGPMVFMKHADNPLMSLIVEHKKSSAWVSKNMGQHKCIPSSALISEGGQQQCNSDHICGAVCNNFYFLANGYSKHFNESIAEDIAESYPDASSTRQLLHYAQLIKSGKFESYDDDEDDDDDDDSGNSHSDSSDESDTEDYNLGNISTKNYLLYVPENDWSNQEDIDNLANKLPNVQEKIKFSQYSCNLDLLIAKDAYHHVYRKIVEILH